MMKLWKYYEIPLFIIAFFMYMLYYGFFLESYLIYISLFFIVYSCVTLFTSFILKQSFDKGYLTFFNCFIFCKALKFFITLILILYFFYEENIMYEYGLLIIEMFFLVTLLSDTNLFLKITDRFILIREYFY